MPPVLIGKKDTELSVFWMPPINTNGPLTSYNAYYALAKDRVWRQVTNLPVHKQYHTFFELGKYIDWSLDFPQYFLQ